MKKKIITIITSALIIMSLTITSLAATAAELAAKYPASYTAETGSIYGPRLDQAHLNAVAEAAADFKNNYINDAMDNNAKIKAASEYMKSTVSYIDWDAGDGANTAYGSLVLGKAACSGYARGFKALMDACDVSCYYVHADATAVAPSHQWNMVEYNDGYYFIDIQLNDDSGADYLYHSIWPPVSYDATQFPQVGSKSGANTSGNSVSLVNAGWKQDSIGWWYQNSDGSYQKNGWFSAPDGKWYYFNESGYMLADTTTPDGYKVDASGAWIQY